MFDFFYSVNDFIERRSHQYSAYIMTLYYFEILYLMIGLMFLYGKAVSIIAGIVLSLLLAVHIIQLYFKKNLHRKLELFIIDIHAAFVVAFLFASVAAGGNFSGTPVFILGIRALTLILELPLIFVLTRDTVVKEYK